MERAPRHGEEGEQATSAGVKGRPVTELLVFGRALTVWVTEADKGLATRRTVRPGRSDCHSAVVPGSQRAGVHGCQGTLLKRLAVTNGMNGGQGGCKVADTAQRAHTRTRGSARQTMPEPVPVPVQEGRGELSAAAVGTAERSVMLGERACLRAVEPADKGGRERTQFWMPNPAAARIRATSCYLTTSLGARCKAQAHSIC